MRIIDDETLDLIAGGYTKEGSTPVVTVPGEVPRDEQPVSWIFSDPEPYPVSGGTEAPPSDPPKTCGQHSSPVPENAPAGVDMNTLRNTILDTANAIKQLDPEVEHGATVIRSSSGDLRIGEMNHGTAGAITISTELRAGDVIVGYIHSHPAGSGLDQTKPSSHDFEKAADLRNKSYGDPGMPIYILDNLSGHVFEYKAGLTNKSFTSGANISTDISGACH